ncbi:unnamed protein product [Angiostrongylus costaricensis]|uniref:Ras-related protein n=1 Tax=Angiostrongylus costaricensis TaxID=334426 RepID=A0A158PIZ7_ANGCS|nr:unnamed protein product [Angiostrongylus costaricensis]
MDRYKILILGRSGSGKSALIHRLKNNVFPDSDAITSFPNVTVIVRAIHGSIIKADLVESDLTDFLAKDASPDTAKVHLAKQTLDVNGLFLIYDITNSETFWEIDEVLRVIPPDVDICLVGTKADMVDHRQISFKEAENKSHQLGFSLVETSAMMGINCEELLLEVLDKVAERRLEVRQYLSESTEVCAWKMVQDYVRCIHYAIWSIKQLFQQMTKNLLNRASFVGFLDSCGGRSDDVS